MKKKKEKISKPQKVYQVWGEKTFEPSWYLKTGLILGFIIAVLESILFIPYAWTIFWFKRFNKTYYGVTRESQKPLGYLALILLGVIPGILILIDYYQNQPQKQSTEMAIK